MASDRGQLLWEVSVEGRSIAPDIGKEVLKDDIFCYISTPWGEYNKIQNQWNGRVVEVCAPQGAFVQKGDVIAFIQRDDLTA